MPDEVVLKIGMVGGFAALGPDHFGFVVVFIVGIAPDGEVISVGDFDELVAVVVAVLGGIVGGVSAPGEAIVGIVGAGAAAVGFAPLLEDGECAPESGVNFPTLPRENVR